MQEDGGFCSGSVGKHGRKDRRHGRRYSRSKYLKLASSVNSLFCSPMERPVPRPLLLETLEAFPSPPTFLPSPTPQSATFNPPPSKPPVGPLPPVPGPSRISDSDTLLFLASTGPSRSRRSSKLSSQENRDSFASTRSDSLLSASSTGSPRSSPRTPSSAAQSLHRPSLAFSIDEQTDDLLQGAPLQDIQKAPLDDDESTHVPKVMPSSSVRPARTPPRAHRESIALSSIAMPAPDDDGPDFDALPDGSRAPSPDIATILATTPRPRLSSLSASRRSLSSHGEPWEEEFIDDYGKPRASVYSESYPFGYDDEMDVASTEGPQILWDGDAPEDSDSDLDLHTSLPKVMVHHGFLSPRSKLVNTAASPSLTPSKEKPARDSRDTAQRRVRHRDGKTLAGGIGLTTGLGWSDSEDEDAPSALTHRISTLNLNRSSLGLSRSTSSMSLNSRPSRASSLSHAGFSRPASHARRTQSDYDVESEIDEFGAWRGNAPPTSWARRSEPRFSRVPSRSRITSMHTDDSGHTMDSATTQLSLPLMRSRSRVLRVMAADKEKPLPSTPGGSIRRTTSSASVGLVRPRAVTGVTPSMLPRTRDNHNADFAMKSTPQLVAPPSTTSIPPLPQPQLVKPQMRPLRLPSRIAGDRPAVPVPGLPTSSTSSSIASSTSSTSFSGLSASTSATSVSLLSPSPSTSLAYMNRTSSPYLRGPAPTTPTTPTTPLYDQQQSGIARPRPRTGTGMVYRTSGNPGVVRAVAL
ncbi:hypothetical protein FB45DRAFT_101401 [Roridomyces roridus]|uniref:Uncharacterized protein n=1 Tax=Roridomyces roridus TaxID=1738132 RepID=A0AAD7BJQ7_9AGAR|nr:hypothetical protein FB45DRAFT_101401 [Roridomyces roridus]